MTMLCMFMIATPCLAVRTHKFNLYHEYKSSVLCILLGLSLVFGIVFGMRWDVGQDNLAYLDIYINNDTENKEYLFKFLNDSLYNAKIHYCIYFGLFAFLQCFLVFYTLKNQSYIWAFLVIALFGGHFFWDWMNGMRQEIASCIMLFGTNFIIKKNLKKYLLCVIVAMGFHISAIIFLLLYYFVVSGKNLCPKKLLQLAIYCVCIVIALTKIDILAKIFPAIELLNQIDELSHYSIYNENVLQNFADITKIGYLFYILCFINIIIILYYNKIRKYFDSKRFTIYYNFYYWGMICETLVASNMVLARPFRYFRIYKLIMIAYLLYYLYSHRNNINSLCFVSILLALLAGVILISITSPFNFYFDIPYAP